MEQSIALSKPAALQEPRIIRYLLTFTALAFLAFLSYCL